MTSKVAYLTAAANLAYDADNQEWFARLTTADLACLWGIACASDLIVVWDDEVHDALSARGWFEA
jgi:hypothetical protein